jgi:uncharacterized protein (TIGR02597 family)
MVYNGVGYDTFYYSIGGAPGVGWRQVGLGSSNRAECPLYSEEGVLVRRLAASSTNLTLVGAVKVTPTVIPMETNFSFVANVYPVDITLGSSQLYTGSLTNGVRSGTASTADQVWVWNGVNGFITYYYSSGGAPGVGWRKVGGGAVDASTNTIPGGVCFIVKRVYNQPFYWSVPKHPVAP